MAKKVKSTALSLITKQIILIKAEIVVNNILTKLNKVNSKF